MARVRAMIFSSSSTNYHLPHVSHQTSITCFDINTLKKLQPKINLPFALMLTPTISHFKQFLNLTPFVSFFLWGTTTIQTMERRWNKCQRNWLWIFKSEGQRGTGERLLKKKLMALALSLVRMFWLWNPNSEWTIELLKTKGQYWFFHQNSNKL